MKEVLLGFIGFSSGVAVSSGVFALISVLGIIPRMAARLGIARYTYIMEIAVMLGGTCGSFLFVYQLPLPLGLYFLAFFGILAGVFVGGLSMSLAENLKVIPILCRRINFKQGIAIVIAALALGKGMGSLYQLFIVGVSGMGK